MIRRSIRKALPIVAVIAVAAAPPAFAGIKENTFTVGAGVAAFTFDGEQHLETGITPGARVGYNITKYLAIEGLFDYIFTEQNSDRDAKAYRYGGDLLWHLLPDSKVVPYLAGGISGLTIERSDAASDTKAVFDYGAGLKYFLTDNMALRADFRHLLHSVENHTLNHFTYGAGIVYQFGGAAEKIALNPQPEPPAPVVKAETPPPPVIQVVEPAPAPKVELVAPAPLEVVEAPAPAPAPLVVPAVMETPAPAPKKTVRQERMKVTLLINFDTGKHDIGSAYEKDITPVGEFLAKYPKTSCRIGGHTDNVGGKDFNRKLSERRANQLKDYLVKKYGIAADRITVAGYGFSKPAATNKTAEGRAKNRRIECIVDEVVTIEE